VAITPRTSSRTFAVSKEIEDKQNIKKGDNDSWFENASKFYENKNKVVEIKPEDKKQEEVKTEVENISVAKPHIKYSPTIFKSKVITKEEKIDIQKKEEEKK
jgi:hypothetical protein